MVQSNMLEPLQNTPQYIPPKPGQTLQTSPQTKAQKKISNAKFPATRTWWENVKSGIGGTPESVEQYSTVTPEQQSILQYLQQLGIQGLQDPMVVLHQLHNKQKINFIKKLFRVLPIVLLLWVMLLLILVLLLID